MVRKGAHGRQRRALLAAALGGRRDEDADVLAVVAARLPLLAGLVPKGLPLGGEVAVAGRDAEEEGVVFLELVRGDEGDGGRLAGCVHFGQDFLRKGLFDSVDERGRLPLVLRPWGKYSSAIWPISLCSALEWEPTGKRRLCLRRPQYRLSLPRQSSQYGHTWNTVSIESVSCLDAAPLAPIALQMKRGIMVLKGWRTNVDYRNLGSHVCEWKRGVYKGTIMIMSMSSI